MGEVNWVFLQFIFAKQYFCPMKKWLTLASIIIVSSCGNDDHSIDTSDIAKQEVVKKLSEKLRQSPDSTGLRMRLINSLDSLKQYDIAIAHTDSLLAKDSMNEGLWLTKAHLQESKKDTANAIRSYEKAIRIYPAVEAQLYLANLFAETRNQKALWLCTNVLRMGLGRETDASCSFIAAVYFSRTGNAKKAIEGFDKAIGDNYTLIDAYLEKGFIFYDAKNYPKALSIFETARKVNNANADVYYWLAKCNEQMDNKQEALSNYEHALALDKQLKEAGEGIKRLNSK